MTSQLGSLSVAYLLKNSSSLFNPTGPRTHVLHTVKGLQQAGHQVTILGLQGRKILLTNNVDNIQYSERLNLSGTRFFKFAESGVRRVQRELGLPYFSFFDSYRFYEGCCKNVGECDLFYERQELMSIGASLASKRLGVPLILEVNADPFYERDFNGTPLRGAQKIVAKWMMNFIYRSARIIVCVSETVKRDLEKGWGIPSERLIVLPNVADVQEFAVDADHNYVRQEIGLNDEPSVVFVGNFQAWHDLDLLVEAFTHVVRSVPKTKLILVGDGPNRSRIEHKIKAAGLQRSVILTGLISHDRIPAILLACDVAVAPYPPVLTGFWGSPMKIFEYMAAGKAIVASRAGQIAKVIEHGYSGLLVEPGEVVRFAQAIVQLLKDPAERKWLGQNARQQAREQHSREQYIKQLEEIFSSVLSGD